MIVGDKMKKYRYLTILLVVVLLMTGCGKKGEKESSNSNSNADGSYTPKQLTEPATSNDTLDAATKQMSGLESATFDMKMEMLSSQGNTTANMKMDYMNATKQSHMTMNVNVLGLAMTEEAYTLVKDGEMYTYTHVTSPLMEEDTGWTYETYPISEYEDDNTESISDIQGLTSKYKQVVEVESDIEGTRRFQITLDKDSLTDTSLDSEVEVTKDFVVDVYVKDGYVVKIVMDLTSVFADIVEEEEEEPVTITKYVVTLEISNHNQITNIEVPQDVLKNAKKVSDTTIDASDVE